MKLIETSGGGDFYESFSDLIFGTLIIFLVVVLALMLQVQQTTSELNRQIGGVVSPHRFSGGTGQTTFAFSILPREDGGTDMLLVPWDTYRKMEQDAETDEQDDVLDLCRLYKEDRLLIISSDDFLGMAGGLTPEPTMPDLRVCPAVIVYDPGRVVLRLRYAESRGGRAFADLSPEAMRAAIGGASLERTSLPGSSYSFDFIDIDQPYWRWLGDGITRGQEVIVGPFNERSRERGGDAVDGIRFGVEGDRLTIGTTSMTPDQFRMLLSVLAPGRGFVLEYDDPSGEENAAAPAWVEQEVLFPAGYDQRELRDPSAD